MKPIATDINFEGNMEAQTVTMQIVDDEVARAFVMKALQNLYSDNEYAVLREIATNARDAHVAAGKGHLPIEVSLPSAYGEIPDPYLRIRDYGDGLSVDDITSMYSKYGASTKRDTNEQVGSLGFGSKSPLAYTDQFNIVSICNGVKILVLVSKDEGGGNMKIVDTRASDEPSGVTVEIPVARWHQFQQKADRLFSYWPEGTVLVNGKQPELVTGHKLNDNLMIVPGGKSYVVMGGVPYPIDHDRINLGLKDGYALVAQVAIGDVEFPPSREALRYTRVTLDRLTQVEADFQTAIATIVQDDVDKCATRPEVIAAIYRWNKLLPESKSDVTYKGDIVPRLYEVPNAAKDSSQRATTTMYQAHKLSSCERRERLDLSWWTSSLFVTGYDRDTFTPPTKKKLEKYVNDNGIRVSNFILLRKKPNRAMLKWIDPKRVVDFEKTIVPIKLPRRYSGGMSAQVGRIPCSYDMFVDGVLQYGIEANTVDRSNPVFYFVGHPDDAGGYAGQLTEANPKNTIIVMRSNREGKFLRDFPTAVDCRTAANILLKEWCASLTENQKIAIKLAESGYRHMDKLKALDTKRLDDSSLRRVVRIAQKDTGKLAQKHRVLCGVAGVNLYKHCEALIKFTDPLDKYELYEENVLRTNPEHVYLYINAVYAYLHKSGK